jgi:hypothetical protein
VLPVDRCPKCQYNEKGHIITPCDLPLHQAKYARGKRTAILWGFFLARAEAHKERGEPLYGKPSQAQREALQPYVQGLHVHDLGAGTHPHYMALELLALGATGVTAIDPKESLPPEDPRIQVVCASLLDLVGLAPDVGFVSWPPRTAEGLLSILEATKTLVYLGKNTDGVSCGFPELFQLMTRRGLLAYVPDRQNCLIVLGGYLQGAREPTGEERAGMHSPSLSYEESEGPLKDKKAP